MKRIVKKIHDWIEESVARMVFATLVLFIVLLAIGLLASDAVYKQTHRWKGWMNAHQMDYVPGLQFNYDQCIGSNPDNKFANIICEEPPNWYKKFWVWKKY